MSIVSRMVTIAAASVSLSAGASAQTAPPPRETVGAVAAKIEEVYFDEQRARTIAADLRSAAARGDYDALTNPSDLANALTDRLQPVDRHFSVRWMGNAASEAGPPTPSADPEVQARRSGYGFRRVEILPGNIGYIDLRSFEPIDWANPEWPVRHTADAALTLVSHANAVIIDLRDNGGGSPDMVGYLASAFTRPDANIYNVFHGRDRQQSERPQVAYPRPMLEVPLYILTSRRTGSAAEALAYTLQAADRATIVGEPSGGAANPGGPVPTGNGFTIFISGASPRNPITGTNWEETGVHPDVETTAAVALDRARLLALETALPSLPAAERLDAQWALEALRTVPLAIPAEELSQLTGDYGQLAVTVENGWLRGRMGQRPAYRLIPLARNLFYVEGEPSRRFFFERNAEGRVVVLEQRFSNGEVTRRSRN